MPKPKKVIHGSYLQDTKRYKRLLDEAANIKKTKKKKKDDLAVPGSKVIDLRRQRRNVNK